MKSLRAKSALQLIITIFFAALVTVLAKQTLAEVDSFTFVWLQMIFGIMTMFGYTFLIKKEKLPKQLNLSVWTIVFAIGICNFTLVRTLFIFALDILPATTHAYLINFVGIVTMLLSGLLLKESPSRFQILGAVIALIGVQIYFYLWPSGEAWLGIFYAGAAVFFLALTNIFIRLLHLKHPQQLSANIVSTGTVVLGGVPLIIWGLVSQVSVQQISLTNWLIIILNGIFSIALTMTVFNIVMRHLKAFEASILASSGLVFTAMFSIPLLGEFLSLHQAAGIVMLIIGILLVQFNYRQN
ncbi:DMT family transporter [Aliikangiella maris]|uniref:DMT family transporter n=2 Tax=Aliikangiella maris TaxID=3162458 RepID=A0ABV2BUG0_9GAMM